MKYIRLWIVLFWFQFNSAWWVFFQTKNKSYRVSVKCFYRESMLPPRINKHKCLRIQWLPPHSIFCFHSPEIWFYVVIHSWCMIFSSRKKRQYVFIGKYMKRVFRERAQYLLNCNWSGNKTWQSGHFFRWISFIQPARLHFEYTLNRYLILNMSQQQKKKIECG